MRTILLYIMLLLGAPAFSQNINRLIGKGNEAYRLQQYDKAVAAYKEALKADPRNSVAAFNMGNALFKNESYEEAAGTFDKAAKLTDDKRLQSQLLYNKGVALTRQKALEESIAAYKQTLRLNSSDTLARENLQRALNEKKQQQQQQENESRKKEQKEDQPKPQPNKLNKQQVEQLLKALEEQERKLHDRMMKKAPVPGQPEKDW
ncbi:tetratricopeptide repeat protein [Agriterribacter sp.]|uniref:tetratricopeptide repeat protein n=1 Tax=Agriterribacter sp. TaxID=2821509 RepID=UPI002CDB2A27|nr:tetratricopeptide repeat protein [Agriterribacter sp.]HRO44621.1 tetratricopeptide repeat protein [Agriterribacter sp.]HRQ16058.1 tetratricopeptide repeat protein [Agriterribacter sp.]